MAVSVPSGREAVNRGVLKQVGLTVWSCPREARVPADRRHEAVGRRVVARSVGMARLAVLIAGRLPQRSGVGPVWSPWRGAGDLDRCRSPCVLAVDVAVRNGEEGAETRG